MHMMNKLMNDAMNEWQDITELSRIIMAQSAQYNQNQCQIPVLFFIPS